MGGRRGARGRALRRVSASTGPRAAPTTCCSRRRSSSRGPVLLGRLVRSRVRLNQALQEKAAALEEDREARAAARSCDERERIAGELHHVVSEALASMVGQAGDGEELRARGPTAPRPRSRRSRRPGARRSARSAGCSACCAARTRSSRSRRSRRSPTSPTSSRACTRRGCRSSSTSRASTRRSRPASTSPPTALVQEALGGALEAPVRAAPPCACATPATSSRSRSPTTASRRPARRARCSACASGSRSTAATSSAERVDGSGYTVRARLPLERAA